MTVEVIGTTNGPVIKSGDDHYTLSDMNEILDFFLEDATLAVRISDQIVKDFMDGAITIANTFRENAAMLPVDKMMANLNAMRQWSEVVLLAVPQYRKALEDAQNS